MYLSKQDLAGIIITLFIKNYLKYVRMKGLVF